MKKELTSDDAVRARIEDDEKTASELLRVFRERGETLSPDVQAICILAETDELTASQFIEGILALENGRQSIASCNIDYQIRKSNV